MTIETLKQESYLLQDGEILTNPIRANETNEFHYSEHYKVFNSNGSTLIFYDECGKARVIPIPGTTLKRFERTLMSLGYLRNATLYVPLSNGYDYPQFKEKWESVKDRINLIA